MDITIGEMFKELNGMYFFFFLIRSSEARRIAFFLCLLFSLSTDNKARRLTFDLHLLKAREAPGS